MVLPSLAESVAVDGGGNEDGRKSVFATHSPHVSDLLFFLLCFFRHGLSCCYHYTC